MLQPARFDRERQVVAPRSGDTLVANSRAPGLLTETAAEARTAHRMNLTACCLRPPLVRPRETNQSVKKAIPPQTRALKTKASRVQFSIEKRFTRVGPVVKRPTAQIKKRPGPAAISNGSPP